MKRRLFLLLALAVILLCAGCIRQDPAPTTTDYSQPPTTAAPPPATTAPPPTTTAPPQVALESGNPLGIEGYTYFESPSANPGGDVFLVAQLDADARMNGMQIWGLTTHSWNGSGVLVEYQLGTEESMESMERVLAWMPRDGSTSRIQELDEYVSVSASSGLISVYSESGWSSNLACYDPTLEPVSSFSWEHSMSYALTQDGSRCYYMRRGVLFCQEDGKETAVYPDANFCVCNILGVITGENGVDYAVTSCLGGDLNYYRVILDCETGKAMDISDFNNSEVLTENNIYLETAYDGQYYASRWIVCPADARWDLHWAAQPQNCYSYILSDGRLLLVQPENNGMRLSLVDLRQGKFTGSSSFTIDNGHPITPDSPRGEVDLCQRPIVLDGGEILLQLIDGAGNQLFYVWKPETVVDNGLEILPYKAGSRPSVQEPEGLNMGEHTPRPVGEALLPLRQRADELEKRYGVEIYIGEECAAIAGGYAVSPLVEQHAAEAALDIFEQEISKYPADFFTQMRMDGMEGYDFYLAGTLQGIEEDVLGFAGGVQCEVDGRQAMFLDCSDSVFIAETLHHEICHSIEDYMTALGEDGGILDEDQWQSLNPDASVYGDCYSRTYAQYGFPENQYLAYDMLDQEGLDVSDAYFADCYSMTFPWEDRARLFQNWMIDYPAVDFSAAPHLKAKLDYFLACMRLAFDSADWEHAPWDPVRADIPG